VDGGGLRRHLLGADGDLVRVHLAQVVVQPGDVGDVFLGRLTVLAGEHVDDADAFTEVGERDPARLHEEVVLRVATAEHVLARRRTDRVLDDVRRDLDDARLAVDLAAAVPVDVDGLIVLDEHPGALEHLEGGEMDVVDLRLGEHVEAEAAAARAAGEQVPLHTRTSTQ
jgi:hypothetical protein